MNGKFPFTALDVMTAAAGASPMTKTDLMAFAGIEYDGYIAYLKADNGEDWTVVFDHGPSGVDVAVVSPEGQEWHTRLANPGWI